MAPLLRKSFHDAFLEQHGGEEASIVCGLSLEELVQSIGVNRRNCFEGILDGCPGDPLIGEEAAPAVPCKAQPDGAFRVCDQFVFQDASEGEAVAGGCSEEGDVGVGLVGVFGGVRGLRCLYF